jgi:hypothetical protein
MNYATFLILHKRNPYKTKKSGGDFYTILELSSTCTVQQLNLGGN